MSKRVSQTAALPIAHVVLRILTVVNWLGGVGILALLVISQHEQWIIKAFKLATSPDAHRVVMGLQAIAILGLLSIPLNYLILKRLLAMVATVRQGDPFVPTNAQRLRAIAWTLLTLQILAIIVGTIGKFISTAAHPINLHAGFSINGALAVLLIFLLARVFEEGTLMREDLEGTV